MDWADSQLIYHALADLGREALCLVHPGRPYLCLGFSQEPERELDLGFCRQAGLPLFRREVGGGTVLLDQNQVFFQVVLRRDHPLVVPNREVFYRRLLEPAVRVYDRVGIPARFAPPNDIAVDDRKLSGTGAGEIGECVVFVGNLILDFDPGLMARAVNSPNPGFRQRAARLMEEGIGSIRQELGPEKAGAWSLEGLTGLLAQEFAQLLGRLEPHPLDDELIRAMARRRERMFSPGWLNRRGRRPKDRRLKIRAGLELVQAIRESGAGPVKALYEVVRGRIGNISLEAEEGSLDRGVLARAEARLEGSGEAELERLLNELLPPGAGPRSPG